MFKAIAITAPIACAADISKASSYNVAFEYRNEAWWCFIRVKFSMVYFLHFYVLQIVWLGHALALTGIDPPLLTGIDPAVISSMDLDAA